MIKAVLFDMDGVLFDSMPVHAQAWQETMEKYISGSKAEDYYLFEGRTGFSTINILFNKHLGRSASDEEVQHIYAQKSRRFAELDNASPMQGALAVLEKVKSLGLQALIVTGSGQLSLFEKIEQYFPGHFNPEQMVTAFDVEHGKPHPEPYLIGLEKADVSASEAIVVENAPLGIESAVAAGIYTIAVNTGPLPDHILSDAGANALYPSMQALADDIENRVDILAHPRVSPDYGNGVFIEKSK